MTRKRLHGKPHGNGILSADNVPWLRPDRPSSLNPEKLQGSMDPLRSSGPNEKPWKTLRMTKTPNEN